MRRLYPLISIITPCYNAAPFIAQTIESVLAQTYPHWEMLTDHSSGSPSLPRNIGLEQAQGEYIAFLDSDDAWFPSKLEEQVIFMESGPYDFVYSDYEKMAWNGKRNLRLIQVRRISSFWDMLESNEIPCLTVLLRKDLIGEARFKSIPKEDYAFWLEILRKGYKAYNTGKVHALYREAKNSRSGNKFEMFGMYFVKWKA